MDYRKHFHYEFVDLDTSTGYLFSVCTSRLTPRLLDLYGWIECGYRGSNIHM